MGKTRVFTGAPVDFTIVVRKYLLSTIRLIQRHRIPFESAPGTVAQSKEWGDIHEFLIHFGDSKIVAGDYKAFDKHMHPAFMLTAFEILHDLCEASGNYTRQDLSVIKAIAYDTVFPMVDYNGDLVEFSGVNPSGHPLTVIINGLVNALYIRYAYYLINPNHELDSFKDNVHLMTYGDDNIMGVSDQVPWFHHTTLQKALESFGVTYTMADKEAASVPYIPIHSASFLKRSWRLDEDIGAYLCPLEHESIEKSLMVWTRSKSISEQEQMSEIMRSALGEYFNYGKEVFLKRRELFQQAIKELDLSLWFSDHPLPTWEDLKQRFILASKPQSLDLPLDIQRKIMLMTLPRRSYPTYSSEALSAYERVHLDIRLLASQARNNSFPFAEFRESMMLELAQTDVPYGFVRFIYQHRPQTDFMRMYLEDDVHYFAVDMSYMRVQGLTLEVDTQNLTQIVSNFLDQTGSRMNDLMLFIIIYFSVFAIHSLIKGLLSCIVTDTPDYTRE
jgi:hypothetical protein